MKKKTRRQIAMFLLTLIFTNNMVLSQHIIHVPNAPSAPSIIHNAPSAPNLKYYKYGIMQNKLKNGFLFPKLNPHLVQAINTNPEAYQELEKYIKTQKKTNIANGVGHAGIITFILGIIDYASNVENKQIDPDTLKFNDDDKNFNIIGAGAGIAILGYLSAFIIGQDQEQNLLNAVNIYNETSENNIELIYGSLNQEQIGIKLVKKF